MASTLPSRLDHLPHEILFTIFQYGLDPYTLFKQIITFRHVNKTFYEMTNDQDFYKVLFADLRPKDTTFDYFPTHAFIDRLLFRTHRDTFKDWTCEESCKPAYETLNGELISYEYEDDGKENLFEKFSEWLNQAYSNCDNVLLKMLIQLCLGREMISHLGISKVGVLIELFFEKLLQPAIELVNSWNETPKEMEWREDLVFNMNLLQVIGTESLFGEDIAVCWSELDGIASCIPRKYLLFIAEKFRDIELLMNDSTRTCMVTQIMKILRDCGIKVERMRFSDIGMHVNYQRTDATDRMIPKIAKSFYLQHLAVWINSPSLLEWCLTVGITSDTNLKHLSNNPYLDISLQAHVNTYIHDACGLTALHYAVHSGNVEISNLLIKKYLANPFVESRISHWGNLTPCILAQLGESDSTIQMIFKSLEEKYGDIKREKEETVYNNEFKMVETLNGFDYEFEEVMEDISDESDNEYGLSYEWIKSQVQDQSSLKRKRNSNHDYYLHNESLRKMRKPIEEFEKVQWNSSQVEFLHETDQASRSDEYDYKHWPFIKIMKRKPNSIEGNEEEREEGHTADETEGKDENEEEIDEKEEENETQQDEKEVLNIGPEFILRKDLTVPKEKMDLLINEVLSSYKSGSFIIPNAKMMIQQAAENIVSYNFTISQDISQFCGRDYVTRNDVALAGYLVSSKTNPKIHHFYFGNRTKTLKSHRDEFVENLNISSKHITDQLGKLIHDESILNAIVEIISEQFENTYLTEIQDEKIDPNYDGLSSDSSEGTNYSEDSMLSNVCFEETCYGFEVNNFDLCYSSISAKDLLNERKACIIVENDDYFTVHETEGRTVYENEEVDLRTRVIYTTDRDEALNWIDNASGFHFPPDEEYLD
ncbi:hypothetical protein NAEGRDRAFT_49622 [Naegleria gruberi]|uniref:F-box domain-containing protein n=1 Tax=Naegleria gruberi TaxID=5762 RepID=D2VHN9_NAEGR|nr:uncharacterized protein NAEGRDRAFT_49622 [Naegleria gruberi]EFC43624.1 hypothetical protein NAEGRDRAFT_49622 [Naegleria gruberi]|eukprot:XP_002676368.1 hypothetical protein NAEGRDRAFT_49622 [Naegleria gruberi strain NEG-M]